MRRILKPVLGGFLALMPAVQASSAPLSRCQAAIVLEGIATHGSIVCNPDWLERGGSHAILREAQSCNKTVGAKALIARGFSDVDRKLKKLGKKAACQEIDDLIKRIESLKATALR